VVVYVTRTCQGVHELAAGTVVVPPDLTGLPAPAFAVETVG
jgi:hypothetical protein